MKDPSRGYLLCCIERTGSNLLAEALAGTGIAGRPLEYFNPVEQNQPWMRSILGDSGLVNGILKVLRAGTTANGVFAAKCHWSHLRHLGMLIRREWSESERTAMYSTVRSQLPGLISEQAAYVILSPRFSHLSGHLEAYKLFESHLPDIDIVWLKRRNMIARAISHFRAKQTGIWYKDSSNTGKQLREHAYEFDLEEIHALYLIGCFQEEMWRQFFHVRGLSPHVVIYEDLVARYEPTVRGVLDFLQLEIGQSAIPQPIGMKQADALSDEWEQRYRQWRIEAGL
jgi:LPS sulfotransferase NodH